MNKRDLDRCRGCVLERVGTNHGREIVHPAVVHPDCPVHGLPEDDWPAGHPLRRHARVIDRETGEALTPDEARGRLEALNAERPEWPVLRGHRFREERPRETEARLYAEARGEEARA